MKNRLIGIALCASFFSVACEDRPVPLPRVITIYKYKVVTISSGGLVESRPTEILVEGTYMHLRDNCVIIYDRRMPDGFWSKASISCGNVSVTIVGQREEETRK